MARLAACYFCGIALDEPLEEYPVVPTAFRDGQADPPTATLCPTCAEKLTEVLGRVTEAADATDAGRTRSGPTPDAADADDVLLDPGAATNGTSNDAGGEDARTVETAADTDTPTDTETAADPEARDRPDDDADAGPADDAGRQAASGSENGPVGKTETGADGEGATGAGDGSDASGRSVVEGEHSISALEYNKVMRLLQNREFPIDRAEIVTVAANAYGLARPDCDHVIDVAIDRGLIEEVDGELRRPDNA